MEIDKNDLGAMLTGLRDDLKQHVSMQMEQQRDELKQHVEVQLDRQRKEYQNFVGVLSEDFADLAAHRADTEGHKRGYMVKEE